MGSPFGNSFPPVARSFSRQTKLKVNENKHSNIFRKEEECKNGDADAKTISLFFHK